MPGFVSVLTCCKRQLGLLCTALPKLPEGPRQRWPAAAALLGTRHTIISVAHNNCRVRRMASRSFMPTAQSRVLHGVLLCTVTLCLHDAKSSLPPPLPPLGR